MEAQPKTQPSVAASVAILGLLSSQTTGLKLTDASDSIAAAVTVDSATGKDVRTAFFYGGGDLSSLGGAVRWAAVQDADALHILSDDGVGNDIARRLRHLNTPFEVSAWQAVDGAFVKFEPAEVCQPPELPAEHTALSELIIAAGAEPVDDHGRLIAEVSGLEVARVSNQTAADGSERVILELGVGQADRELHQLIHGTKTVQRSAEANDPEANDAEASNDELLARLTTVVNDVDKMRATGGVEHPLARLGHQRRIRAALVADPSLIQAKSLRPVPPLRPRETVLGSEAAAAVGLTAEGGPLVVVCSAGVDLDLPAEAADYRSRFNDAAHLRVVVPERDLYLVEPAIMDLLSDVSVVPIPEF